MSKEHVIINQHTYKHKNHRTYETNGKPSLTIPGQTLSLKVLLERFTRGQHVETFTPVYDDGQFPPEIERMDKLDKLDYARQLREGIAEVQNRATRPKPSPTKPAAEPYPAPQDNPLEKPGGDVK